MDLMWAVEKHFLNFSKIVLNGDGIWVHSEYNSPVNFGEFLENLNILFNCSCDDLVHEWKDKQMKEIVRHLRLMLMESKVERVYDGWIVKNKDGVQYEPRDYINFSMTKDYGFEMNYDEWFLNQQILITEKDIHL
jgi:hypothetical protein